MQNELSAAIESHMGALGLEMAWEAGDFSINDNLAVGHYAVPGTQDAREVVGLRVLHRTTILGEGCSMPTKQDGRRSFWLDARDV